MPLLHTKKICFLLLLIACTLPAVTTVYALIAGILFSLLFVNPWPQQTSIWSKNLLQISVVGLGFGVSIGEVWQVGKSSVVYTVVGIVLTLAVGTFLGRFFRAGSKTSTLIAFGTAICGGSAIAAMSPVIGSDDDETAVALATVFTLNAVALVLFPLAGHFFDLSQHQFGLWAALAIHDTSSVVGAASSFGSEALSVATTVKLVRAMWIAPVVIIFALLLKSEQKAKFPLFILGFVIAATLASLLPQYEGFWSILSKAARQSLVATLFLIGAGLSKKVLKDVGFRPMLQGVTLWVFVSGLTLIALLKGWIS
ncbi:MAG: putative sulfate exporter family transporter [Desulfuromonadaceae bacterium]|nr:putative sulfate exporter family transporter [Desulfuromonadaceae bacterium]